MKKITLLIVMSILLFSINIEAQRIRGIDYLGFAKKLFDEGFYKIALEEYKQFLIDNPESENNYVIQYYIGECCFLMGDYKNALEQFLILTTRYPDAPNVILGWEAVGNCYEKMSDFKRSAEIFETAGNFFFHKGDVASSFFLGAGKNYARIGEVESAKKNFLRIMDNYPGSNLANEASYELGLIYLKEGNLISAIKEFERVKYITENPSISASSRLLLGKIYLRIGDYEKSESEFLTIIQKHKDIPELFYDSKLNLGIMYVSNGNYLKGREVLDELIKDTQVSDSLLVKAMISIGDSYFYEGNYPQAVDIFNNLTDKYPLTPAIGEIFYKLSLCFEKLGNDEQVLYNLRRSINYAKQRNLLDDFQKMALNKIINLYEKKGEYKESTYYLENFINSFDKESEFLLIKIADLYEKAGDYGNSARIYSLLEDRFKKSPNVDYYIYRKGISFEESGLIQESIREYRKLLNDFPGNDYVENINLRISILKDFNITNIPDKLKLLEFFNSSEIKDIITNSKNISKVFEVGKYYYETRRFNEAIPYFKIVLENEKNEIGGKSAEFIALSYDNITKKYFLDDDYENQRVYTDSAFYYYTDYIKNGYFTKDFIDNAKLRIAEIDIQKENDKFERKRKGMNYYSVLNNKEFTLRDFVLLRLGEIYTDPETMSEISDIQLGRNYFDELVNTFPNSPNAERAKFQLGCSYYLSNETQRAQELFKKYLIEYPNGLYSSQVYFYLGKIALRNKDEFEFSRVFKILSENFYYSVYVDSVFKQWGDFYFNNGSFKESIEKYTEVYNRIERKILTKDLKSDEEIMDISIKIASAYDNIGFYRQAILFLNNVMEKNPEIKNISQIYYVIGKIYEKANYLDKAVEVYQKIEEKFPEESFIKEILIRRSELLFEMTRFVDAHNDYEKIANFAENLNEKINYKSKAVVCLYRNNDIKAGDEEAKTFEKEFKDLENKNYYKYLFLLEKGKAYYKNKDLNEASKIFETVTKEGEKEEIAPEAELYIGLIYQSKNNQVEALKYYSSIQTKYPNAKIWDKIYNTLGFYYYGIGQFPEAAKYFRMAIENSPSKKVDRYALNNLILSYRYSEWIDSELSALRRYVNLFPDADDILQKKIDIGIAMVNIGNFKEAIEYLKPLFTEATLEKEVDIQMQIAMAYEGLGNNEKAISEWLKVLYYGRSEVPKLDIYVKYRLAEICEKVGLYDKSMKFYEEIIEKEGAASDLGKPAQKGLERVRERIDTIGGQKNVEKIK